MTRAVEGFTGLEHALEPVAEIGGVRFVNDSKATNVEAARRAIESFGAGLVVILGGRFKGGDFARPARRRCASARGDGRGDRRGAAAACTQALATAVPVHDAGDMHDAVRTAFASASPGRHGACSRRRARASTCSATTRSAGGCSSRKSLRLAGGVERARVSSEQSSVRSRR